MLDPAEPKPLNLEDFTGYIQSCLELAEQRLADYPDVEAVARDEDQLNLYPRLEALQEPRDIYVLDEEHIKEEDLDRARQALLEGRVLLEHACAGEATRLGLGTKYLINPRLDLSPQVLTQLLGEGYQLKVQPESLRSMSLGRRHMLQLAWDLSQLARQGGLDPERVLKRQRLLVIVNEASWEAILADFMEADFYGFDRPRVLFMVQKAFHGITRGKDGWVYDTSSPRRLHNHGQMLMQTTMDNQVFRLSETGRPSYLSWAEYRQILGECEDKVSFNIEDLDYLDQSLDLTGLAAALKLADAGARMVMEVVTNNPRHPQKGGMCAWDAELGRNVMIESFQLAGIDNAQITHLNKNINHYPYPAIMATRVRESGLPMPIAVKQGYLYYQPVQGDVNFLVETAFVRRPQLKPIRAWKSGANTPEALEAMARQEARPGFLDWAQEITGLDL
jgi:hypothetical protein